MSSLAGSNGLAITGTSANRTLLLREKFRCKRSRPRSTSRYIHFCILQRIKYFFRQTEPSIPETLPLLDITALDDSFDPVALRRLRKVPWKIQPFSGSGPLTRLTATDLSAAYILNVSLDGSGHAIGIVSLGNYAASDIKMYASQYGKPIPTIRNVAFPGSDATTTPAVEDSIDISMALALAPRATIMVYSLPTRDFVTLLNETAEPTMGEPLGEGSLESDMRSEYAPCGDVDGQRQPRRPIGRRCTESTIMMFAKV